MKLFLHKSISPDFVFCPHFAIVCGANHLDIVQSIFIEPESDHCLPLSVTDSLTDTLTPVNLIDVTLACEGAYSKLVEVVTVNDVSDEDHVGTSLLQIWR